MKKNENKNKNSLLIEPILTTHIEALSSIYKEACKKADYDTCSKVKIELEKILSTGSDEYLMLITTEN